MLLKTWHCSIQYVVTALCGCVNAKAFFVCAQIVTLEFLRIRLYHQVKQGQIAK